MSNTRIKDWLDMVEELRVKGWDYQQRGMVYVVFPRRPHEGIPEEYLRQISLPARLPDKGNDPENKEAALRRAGLFDDYEELMKSRKPSPVTQLRPANDKGLPAKRVEEPDVFAQIQALAAAIADQATGLQDKATEMTCLVDKLRAHMTTIDGEVADKLAKAEKIKALLKEVLD